MIRALQHIGRYWQRFSRDQSGNGTIEFVLILPAFIAIFLSTFELGMLMSRQVMLDRGLDMAVRQVRLGLVIEDEDTSLHDAIKAQICANASLIPNCLNEIRLEMQPINPRAWSIIPDAVDCVDRDDPGQPARNFVAGVSNQLMILRACALFDPYFPTTGLGAALPRMSGGAYGLISVSSFVIEPNS